MMRPSSEREMRKSAMVLLVALLHPGAALAADGQILKVNPWMILPFILLLLAIALAPFLHRYGWEKYYPLVALGLGFFVFSYYVLYVDVGRMMESMGDYFSFIVLIGSLYVAAGGIFLHTERHATPFMNTWMLAAGALAANVLGTTGASMLLIRPFVRINRPRIRGFHVVFFIFIVSNVGGALTPIGDPPLFLGYLNGVPFHWTIRKLWHIWLLGVILILVLFFLIDSLSYARWVREKHHRVHGTRFQLMGTQNFVFLFIILAAVFAATPVREFIMIAAAAAAYRFARKDALRANRFTFAPIREVAILFAGIFATMVPALDWLSLNAHRLGINTPGQFFWTSGILSSFLDNAPTYLNFLSASMGLHHLTLGNPEHMKILLAEHAEFLQAISIGAVFFGANTYIGNGPNFMVKAIAEHAGVECPSFFGYILRYSLPVLMPIFALVWFLFFR
jgi:Na+/H+ antiporter NhaD/arsenite permease-like protein